MPVQNAEIAGMFDQTADLLELKGDNPFRIRAYRKAARVIEALPQSVKNMMAHGDDLSELPGIGKDLAGKIGEIATTGHFAVLDALKKKLPGEVGEMAALPGLGPKRVKLIYDNLKVRSLEDLRRAARAGRLDELKGFGPAIAARVLEALEKPKKAARFKLSMAAAEVDALIAYLGHAQRVVAAGSFRRRRDTVGDLDLLAVAGDGLALGEKLARYENVARILARGPTRTAVVLRSGLQVDLRVVPEKSYGVALLYFTGSKAHNIALRRLAMSRHWKLNEYGLFSGSRQIAGRTEEEVYEKLGLAFIAPELREDRGEIARAHAHDLPTLIETADVKGDLHVHSDWTDGTASIEDMARAAQALGYEYIALTDHSRRIAMAHGLDPVRLARQIREIDRVNEKLSGITILKGIEVDILKDGSLDLPAATLDRLDVVIGSVHSHFELPRKVQTERVVRALQGGHVAVLGHPTGRLIGERKPCDLDMEKVIAAARDVGCSLEINAEPDRLDLDDIHAQACAQAKVTCAISTDAHSLQALHCMHYGIEQARRGWLQPGDVINTRSLRELRKLLTHRRSGTER